MMLGEGLSVERTEITLFKTAIKSTESAGLKLNDPRVVETVVVFLAENYNSNNPPKVTQHLPPILEGRIRRIKTG